MRTSLKVSSAGVLSGKCTEKCNLFTMYQNLHSIVLLYDNV